MSVVDRGTTFVKEAYAEARKVAWPTREELRESTMVVIVATFIVMLYLFVVDRILSFLLDFIIR